MKKLSVLLAAGVIAVALAGGGGAWWYLKIRAPAAAGHVQPAPDKTDYKYVTLDKVVVMLRNPGGEPAAHYLSVDLVFKTPADSERATKDHLPLLRSVAVRALSVHTLESASRLTIDQLTAAVNDAFAKSYAADQRDKPFVAAMIGKLIIE